MFCGALAGQGVDAHYDDTGPILDDEQRRRRIEGGGPASTSTPAVADAADAPGSGGDPTPPSDGSGAEPGRQPNRMQQRANLQVAILEGIQVRSTGIYPAVCICPGIPYGAETEARRRALATSSVGSW